MAVTHTRRIPNHNNPEHYFIDIWQVPWGCNGRRAPKSHLNARQFRNPSTVMYKIAAEFEVSSSAGLNPENKLPSTESPSFPSHHGSNFHLAHPSRNRL
jgi:hypothetical protein